MFFDRQMKILYEKHCTILKTCKRKHNTASWVEMGRMYIKITWKPKLEETHHADVDCLREKTIFETFKQTISAIDGKRNYYDNENFMRNC